MFTEGQKKVGGLHLFARSCSCPCLIRGCVSAEEDNCACVCSPLDSKVAYVCACTRAGMCMCVSVCE